MQVVYVSMSVVPVTPENVSETRDDLDLTSGDDALDRRITPDL
jgi:hypothetical protein